MTEYIILAPLLIQIIGIIPVVITDKYIQRVQRGIMLHIITLIALLVAQNVVEYVLKTSWSEPYLRTLVSIFGYCVRPTILLLFSMLIAPHKKHYLALGLLIANNLAYLTATFSHWVFWTDENNNFHRGSIGYTAYFMSALLMFYLIYTTFSEYRHRKSALWVVLTNVVILTVSAFLEVTPAYFDYPVTYLTIAIVSCSLFYYIWLHLEFVREHEDDLMAKHRIKIMMTQIQPHFLYNTLSTIQSLCITDPKKAFHTTEIFGTYLRQNLDSLEQSDLIPLQKELEHTQIYAEIEMIRFPKIHVEYDIQYDDFKLPALTIQPLVENAIRHGVRSRENGEVKVTAKEQNGYYIVSVKDNGIGFDPKSLENMEGTHIGVANVKRRIEDMCTGTLTINSVIDKGTEIIISIPTTRRGKYENIMRR